MRMVYNLVVGEKLACQQFVMWLQEALQTLHYKPGLQFTVMSFDLDEILVNSRRASVE